MGKRKPPEPRLDQPGEMFLYLRAYALLKLETLEETCCGIGPIEKRVRHKEWRAIEHWIMLTHRRFEEAQARDKDDPHGLDKMTTRLRKEVGTNAFGWMEGLIRG